MGASAGIWANVPGNLLGYRYRFGFVEGFPLN
jgi:hypothetical protein